MLLVPLSIWYQGWGGSWGEVGEVEVLGGRFKMGSRARPPGVWRAPLSFSLLHLHKEDVVKETEGPSEDELCVGALWGLTSQKLLGNSQLSCFYVILRLNKWRRGAR